MQDQIETGIASLDEILRGGIPKGHTVLLAGGCGTGKTIMCEQFLFHGAKNGEPGLYLSLGEPKEKIIRNMEDFKFYDPQSIENDLIRIIDITQDAALRGTDLTDGEAILNIIRDLVDENSAKRVVIDSVTSLVQAIGDEKKIRNFIFELGLRLSYMGCTLIMISEIPPQTFIYSVFGVEEFIADGVILLTEFERKGGLIRALQVIKMRGVSHSRNKHILKITEEGIELIPMFKASM